MFTVPSPPVEVVVVIENSITGKVFVRVPPSPVTVVGDGVPVTALVFVTPKRVSTYSLLPSSFQEIPESHGTVDVEELLLHGETPSTSKKLVKSRV